MASGVIWSAIFLGNLPEIDTNESTTAGENTGPLLTTFGSAGAPLYDQVVDISTNSADTTVTSDNAASGDTVSYDLGSGPQVSTIDAGLHANVTIVFWDDSSLTTNVGIFQDQLGNVFMLAFDSQTVLGSQAIKTVTVNSLPSSGSSYNQYGFDDVEFVCFGSGTLIECSTGPRAIESIQTGDYVQTMDHGPQTVRWAGQRTLHFPRSPDSQKPILIRAGALGEALPQRDLVVSPQHRIMIRHNGSQVFVIARALTGLGGIRVMSGKRHVTYHSLLLDRHEVLIAEGTGAESLYPGPVAMQNMTATARMQIYNLFPSLMTDPKAGFGPLARVQLPRRAFERLLIAA